MKTRHPIQPLAVDEQGVLRFQSNRLVSALLDHGQETGLGLRERFAAALEAETVARKGRVG